MLESFRAKHVLLTARYEADLFDWGQVNHSFHVWFVKRLVKISHACKWLLPNVITVCYVKGIIWWCGSMKLQYISQRLIERKKLLYNDVFFEQLRLVVIKTSSFLFLSERLSTIFLLSCCLWIFCWLCKSEQSQRNNPMPSDLGIFTWMTGKQTHKDIKQKNKWVTQRWEHHEMEVSWCSSSWKMCHLTVQQCTKTQNHKTVRQWGLIPTAKADSVFLLLVF